VDSPQVDSVPQERGDGLQFDPAIVKTQRIKEEADYDGVRVTFLIYLERARIPMQIDMGSGTPSRHRQSRLRSLRSSTDRPRCYSPTRMFECERGVIAVVRSASIHTHFTLILK